MADQTVSSSGPFESTPTRPSMAYGRRRLAHPFGPRLSSLIGRLGRFSAERPRAVLAVCALSAVLCALLLATGVVTIIVETDSTKLWVPRASATQMSKYTRGFEDPQVAVAIISSRDGGSMTQLPQIIEAVRLDTALRTARTSSGDDFDDVCYVAAESTRCPPSSVFTLWNNTDASSARVSSAIPMIKAALHAASGSLNAALSDFLGCIEQLPSDPVATFEMLRLVYQLAPGQNATEWAEQFQRATLHGSYESIDVVSMIPGSYDKELSGMSWDDLVLTLYWLPMLAICVPLYMARTHSLSLAESGILLLLEIGAILLAITLALVLMALLDLSISPMWLAAPLLAMGYGLDDMFVLLSAFSEARAAQGGRPVLLEHIQSAFESAGISCLCTSLTSFVVFVIGGATSSVLAIQSFCWLSALIALLDFVLQVAVFGAAMALVLNPRYIREGEAYAVQAQAAATAAASQSSRRRRALPWASRALQPGAQSAQIAPDEPEPRAVGASRASSTESSLLALAPTMPLLFSETHAHPRFVEKASHQRLHRFYSKAPAKWVQIVLHYTLIPLVLIGLICTACASDLAQGEVALGIEVAGLAKAGSYLIDFDAKSRQCFNQGEWAYLYVSEGEPHSFEYQQQLRQLVSALSASEHVLTIGPWLLDFAQSYVPAPDELGLLRPEADGVHAPSAGPAQAFARALFAHVHEEAHAMNAAHVVWQLPERPAAAAEEEPALSRPGAGRRGLEESSSFLAPLASSVAASRAAHRLSPGDSGFNLEPEPEPAELSPAPGGQAPPAAGLLLTTRRLDALPASERDELKIGSIRLPFKIAPCDDDRTDGESLHECQLRSMLALRETVAAHRGELDAHANAPSFASLEQYVHMRADVRRALLRCTLAAAGVTFVLVLGYSVWEALIVSALCLGSLALCNVVILGVMKRLEMNLHFLSAVMLQMGVGFIVDYHIHIASKFMATKVGATAAKRVVKTIESVGSAVLASMVTTLLVVLPFLWARWAAMRMLMTLMFVIVAVGGIFSLGLLPLLLAHLPRWALAPAPGRRRQATILLANAKRWAARAGSSPQSAGAHAGAQGQWSDWGHGHLSEGTPSAFGSPSGGARSWRAGGAYEAEALVEAVAGLRTFSATAIEAAWRSYWVRKQFVAQQYSSAVFLAKWRQAANALPLPALPAKLTVHEAASSPLRIAAYTAALMLQVSMLVVSTIWEQFMLWGERPLAPASLLLSFITSYLSIFFCGFIATMIDPRERFNLTLNALAPVHPSLLGPNAHLPSRDKRDKGALRADEGSTERRDDAGASAAAAGMPAVDAHAHASGRAAAAAAAARGPVRGLLPKSEWPCVAVIVPCYKEPDELIAATIEGCLRQVYPSTRLHVYLLDDNQNQVVRDARKAVMDAKYLELFGLPDGSLLPEHKRPGFSVIWRPDNSNAKAGNMNHWIEHASHGFAWEFFALFDCDMVPHRLFVQEMLPAMLRIDLSLQPLDSEAQHRAADGELAKHVPTAADSGLRVLNDPTVAFITTRQTFRDVPALDPLGHGQDMMYDTWEPALDATDQALFLGTNAIFSRAAVEAVGLFPYKCLTEDTLMCLRLHTAGYRCLYYPRTFTSGLAPDTIRAAFRQRTRWAHGNLQILWGFNPMLNTKLDWRMRVVFTTILIVNLSGFPLLFLSGFSICVQLGVLQLPSLPVALGLIKLFVWLWQYVILFNTAHIMPFLNRPIIHVWRQTQMALCFTMCGMQVILEQGWKQARLLICGVQPKAEVFKPTIDVNRVEVPFPPELVQMMMALFLFAASLIASQWYKTLLPLVLGLPQDPNAFTYLVGSWLLMTLPFMLGWPWAKVYVGELAKMAADRAAESAEREKAQAAQQLGLGKRLAVA